MKISVAILTLGLVTLAAAADDIQPTPINTSPITVHLDAQHSLDVIAEVVKQSRAPVEAYPENLWENYKNGGGPPTAIDLNAENQPFWAVIHQLCEGSKLTPTITYSNRIVTLQYSGGSSVFDKRQVFHGAQASFIAQSIQRNHSVDLAGDNPAASKSSGITMNLLIDPRLHALKYQRETIVESAVDENGTSIMAAAPAQTSMQQMQGTWQVNGIFAPLNYDPQVSKKLGKIKGSVRVSSAAEIVKLDLDLASAKGTSHEIAGRTIHIDEVKDENNTLNVTITITRKDMPAEQFNEIINGIYEVITLQSADGKRRNNGGGGGGGGDSITYSVQASYQKEQEKAVKLVWEIPTTFEDVDLPFEFKELPLP